MGFIRENVDFVKENGWVLYGFVWAKILLYGLVIPGLSVLTVLKGYYWFLLITIPMAFLSLGVLFKGKVFVDWLVGKFLGFRKKIYN